MPRRPAAVLELDPSAAALLDLLVELGHLDERLLQVVNDRLLDLGRDDQPASVRPISLQDLKRVSARVILENLDDTDPDYQRAIAREWAMLFH